MFVSRWTSTDSIYGARNLAARWEGQVKNFLLIQLLYICSVYECSLSPLERLDQIGSHLCSNTPVPTLDYLLAFLKNVQKNHEMHEWYFKHNAVNLKRLRPRNTIRDIIYQ